MAQSPEKLEILIPARKQWSAITSLGGLAGVWYVAARANLITRGGFDYLLIVVWGLATVSTLASMVWMLAGYERITIDRSFLSVRYEVLGFARTKRFVLGDVRGLRYSPVPRSRNGLLPSGVIAFDYGARTYRIAGSIDEPEAKSLIEQLRSTIPMP